VLKPDERSAGDDREPESLGLRLGVLGVRILALPILLFGALVWLVAIVIAAPFYASGCLYRRFVKPLKAQTEIGPESVSFSDPAAPPQAGQAEAIRS
jgi:hypothetical protein